MKLDIKDILAFFSVEHTISDAEAYFSSLCAASTVRRLCSIAIAYRVLCGVGTERDRIGRPAVLYIRL